MKIHIHGAKTLTRFTNELLAGFDSAEGEDYAFEIFQIHASPASLKEDLEILQKIQQSNNKYFVLVHRPDELLLYSELKACFEKHPKWKLIFLGDLVLKDPFWSQRRENISVIPHFYMSLNMPQKAPPFIVGSFTSWGEMRSLEHYFSLVHALKNYDAKSLKFIIGGTLNGVKLKASDILDSSVELAEELFIPHFNVQLYHLKGLKRLGESSGSLHAGLSIPVIFEANGMERIEGMKVIKILANDDLSKIDYAQAASEIMRLIEEHQVDHILKHNLRQARLNTPVDFANQVICKVLA